MSEVLLTTPYTPVFPPTLSILKSPSPASTSSDSIETSSDKLNKTPKPYIDRLKERYILLANLPEELCPPSREASPEAENRIDALRLRMRKARELRFPHVPELTLACVGVRGGDWVGESRSDDEESVREYVLPDTEEEWFKWEKKKKVARELRKAERTAAEHGDKIAQWSYEVEDATPVRDNEAVGLSQERRRVDGGNSLGFPVVKRAGVVQIKDKGTKSRYFAPQSPAPGEHREQSDPVERASSPIPPAPALDPLPDFSDSFSLPDSPPSLPQDVQDLPFPDDVPPTPSFAQKDTHTSTPRKVDHPPDPVLQLSSPVSPPRSLRPLTASHTVPSLPSKRPRGEEPPAWDVSADGPQMMPSTPRAVKRSRTMVEPITPTSVVRPSASQEQAPSSDLKRLPTLTALLAASSKKASPRVRPKPSPSPTRHRLSSAAVPDFSPSQPTYSMFRPEFQSTQARAWSLPPSPTQPMTSTQPLSPQKTFPDTASSGIGFYQSQFNVEGKIDEVAAFLSADVWDINA